MLENFSRAPCWGWWLANCGKREGEGLTPSYVDGGDLEHLLDDLMWVSESSTVIYLLKVSAEDTSRLINRLNRKVTTEEHPRYHKNTIMLSYHRSLVVHPVQPIDVYPQCRSTQFKIHDFPKARSMPEAQVMTHPFPLQLMMLKSTKPRVIVSEGEFQNITKNHNRLTASLFPIICPKS